MLGNYVENFDVRQTLINHGFSSILIDHINTIELDIPTWQQLMQKLTLPLTLGGESVCQRLQKSVDDIRSDLTKDIDNIAKHYLIQHIMKHGSPTQLKTWLQTYPLEEIYDLLANKDGLPDVSAAPRDKQNAFARVILQETGLMFAFKGHMEPHFNLESDPDKKLYSAFNQLVS